MSGPDEYVVITGGPGAGKSALVDALARRGYAVSPEVGREILKDQLAIGGPAQHTADALLYAELMLSWEMRAHRRAAARTGPVFFDRGVTELVGYYRLLGAPVPRHVTVAAELFRYHRRVFVAPPWPEIYTSDAERTQDFDEAIRTHDEAVGAYVHYGYEPLTLPKVDVEARAEFVLEHIG